MPRMATACPTPVRRNPAPGIWPVSGFFCRALSDYRGFVSWRRYRLPWLRFVTEIRFVRGVVRALQIAVASFGREAVACHEWRQPARHRFGEPVASGIWPVSGFFCRALSRLPWLRFVKALQITVGSFRQRISVRSGKPPGVTSCRGLVSSAEFGSFGETTRRYILPWVRFVGGTRFVPGMVHEALQNAVGSFRHRNSVRSGRSRGDTDCRGFVSSAAFGSFGEFTRRYRLPWLRFVSGVRFVRGVHEALQLAVGSYRRRHQLTSSSTTVGSAEVSQIAKDREEADGCFDEPYYRASNVIVPVPSEERGGWCG